MLKKFIQNNSHIICDKNSPSVEGGWDSPQQDQWIELKEAKFFLYFFCMPKQITVILKALKRLIYVWGEGREGIIVQGGLRTMDFKPTSISLLSESQEWKFYPFASAWRSTNLGFLYLVVVTYFYHLLQCILMGEIILRPSDAELE